LAIGCAARKALLGAVPVFEATRAADYRPERALFMVF